MQELLAATAGAAIALPLYALSRGRSASVSRSLRIIAFAGFWLTWIIVLKSVGGRVL